MKALIGLVLAMATSVSAIPQQINYQGQLTSPTGTPLDTTVAMTFSLFGTVSGGTAVWTETHTAIAVTDGLFNVLLGSVTALPDSFAVNRWLGITIGTDTEMSPRQQVVSVAHAYRVGTVDGASGGAISGSVNIGSLNTVTGTNAFVVGTGNTVVGERASVAGGDGNILQANFAFIGGGENNIVGEFKGAIVGGSNNSVSGFNGFIGGGSANDVAAPLAAISGGVINAIFAGSDLSFVGGGSSNTVSSEYVTIGGGNTNAASSRYATIGGGNSNSAFSYAGVIGGGFQNVIEDSFATVSGGINNTAETIWAVVGGGLNNIASDTAVTISGGRNNGSNGRFATVGGGDDNAANGSWATVAGGFDNSASASWTAIPGGYQNLASAQYAVAMGRYARAINTNSFVFSAGGDTTQSFGVNTFTARAPGGVRFYTDTSATNIGASLAAGSGTWSALSDRNVKENFEVVDTRDVLKRVASLDVARWNYKTQDDAIRHIGPMAQDFHSAFGVGENETTITTVDADGVLFAAVQEIAKQMEALRAENLELRNEISALKK